MSIVQPWAPLSSSPRNRSKCSIPMKVWFFGHFSVFLLEASEAKKSLGSTKTPLALVWGVPFVYQQRQFEAEVFSDLTTGKCNTWVMKIDVVKCGRSASLFGYASGSNTATHQNYSQVRCRRVHQEGWTATVTTEQGSTYRWLWCDHSIFMTI